MKKQCTKCKKSFSLNWFNKDKNRKDGYSAQCKTCAKEYRLKNKERLKQKSKEYYKNNKEHLIRKNKEYYCKNRTAKLRYKKNYNQRNRENINKKQKLIRKSYPERNIFNHIKARCNNAKNAAYKSYGGRGIKCLITKEEIRKLMVRDNYWKLKKPTIDRIDNDGNYEVENCQFIELSENAVKDKRKPVLQYTLEGRFVREWDSASDARRNLNISTIRFNLVGKTKKAGGFIWKYK